MPRQNSVGDAVTNGVNGPATVASRVLAEHVGMACWLTDTDIVFVNHVKNIIETLNVVTGERRTVANRGANDLIGKHGVWAARLGVERKADGRVVPVGYFDSRDPHAPDRDGHVPRDWHPLDISKSGRVLVCPDRSNGGGLAWWDNKTLDRVYDGQIDRMEGGACAVGDVVLALLGGRLRTLPEQGWATFTAFNLSADDDCVTGWSPTYGLFAWRAGASDKAVALAFEEHDFNPNIRVLPDNLVRVATSYGAGELPGELRTYTINHAVGSVTLTGPGRPQETIPLQTVALSVARPVHSIYPPFVRTGRKVCVLVMDEPGNVPRLTPDSAGPWGTVDRDPSSAIAQSVAAATSAGRYFWGYYDDHHAEPDPKKIPPGQGALLKAYVKPEETVNQHRARMFAQALAFKERGIRTLLMASAHRAAKADGSFWRTTDQVRWGLRTCYDICCAGLADGVVVFAYDRSVYDEQGNRLIADGARHVPEFWADIQAMRAASGDWREFPIPTASREVDMTVPKDRKSVV